MSGRLPDEIRRKINPRLVKLLELQPKLRRQLLRRMGPESCRKLATDWRFWARPDQIWEPGAEKTTFACTGRGWGKTRFGSETTHMVARYWSHICGGRMVLIGRTAADVRDVMIQGESGLLATGDPDWRPTYEPSKRLVTWPNGTTAILRSGEEPAQIRGLNVGFAWCDEYAFWSYPQTSWDNLMLALRIGDNPKVLVTSTPLPTQPVRDLYSDPTTRVITGSTLDNVGNLAPDTVADMVRRFGGTELGDQELFGLILDGNKRALWQPHMIRRGEFMAIPELVRVVVAIDPAGGSTHKKSDETGIVCVGITDSGSIYVLGDVSGAMSSADWGKAAVDLAVRWEADTIIGESNFGGDMVGTTIRNTAKFHEAGLKFELVHAKDSKAARAQPVAQLYEQGRAYHVGNPAAYTTLEWQLSNFDPTLPRTKQKSPDRMDALVHAVRALIGEGDAGDEDSANTHKATWRAIFDGMRRRRAADPWEELRRDMLRVCESPTGSRLWSPEPGPTLPLWLPGSMDAGRLWTPESNGSTCFPIM